MLHSFIPVKNPDFPVFGTIFSPSRKQPAISDHTIAQGATLHPLSGGEWRKAEAQNEGKGPENIIDFVKEM